MRSDGQRAALLQIARQAIEVHLRGEPAASVVRGAESGDEGEASGVFVTIKYRGELRGCLGVLELSGPLEEEVARCARDSATADPRFPPLNSHELPETSLEISILGPLEVIDPADESALIIGRHGLVVERGARRGLLLPQVAVEWGWAREHFLRQTCRKAGLPEDAWQSGAQVFRFDAEVFGE
jgi:AmmeMemoRadiSam system protein A